jgi:hypothetical protein
MSKTRQRLKQKVADKFKFKFIYFFSKQPTNKQITLTIEDSRDKSKHKVK